MTDLKKAAVAAFTDVAWDRGFVFSEDEATRIVEALAHYLRSSTAPARTEERPMCQFCDGKTITGPWTCWRCGRTHGLEPSADVGEGPSDATERKCTMLACPLPYGHGGRCAVPENPENPSYEELLLIVRHGALGSVEQRARALYNAGRSSAARELAETRRRHSEQLDQLIRDHREEVEAGVATVAEKDRELAELREKVRAWEAVVQWALRHRGDSALPQHLHRLTDCIPQNLRPGEGEPAP